MGTPTILDLRGTPLFPSPSNPPSFEKMKVVAIFLLCCLALATALPQRPLRKRVRGRIVGGVKVASGRFDGSNLPAGQVDRRGCWAGARGKDKFCCSGATPNFDGTPATKPCPITDNGGSPVCNSSYC